MKPQRVLSILLSAGALATGVANAAAPTQFTVGAGEVRDFVAVSATTGYAATLGGGLWKTTNSGANWSKTTLAAKQVWKVAPNAASAGVRLYAATGSGLFRSTDSGANWTQLTRDATRAVVVSPSSAGGGPDTILIGVPGVGILRSTDSGATIARISNGLDSTDVTSIVFVAGSSTSAYAVLRCNVDNPPQMAGNWGGVFRSLDANAGTPTWTVFNDGLPGPEAGFGATGTRPCVSGIASAGTAGSPALAVGIKDTNTNGGGTFYVNNSTSQWTASASNPLPYGVEWIGPDFSSTAGFFAGSNQFGPYRSGDSGVNFASPVNPGIDPDLAAPTFATGAFTGTVWMAGIGGLGLFRTTTGASPWSLPAAPVRADRVNDLTNHEVVAAGTYYMALKSGGTMKSTDSGANWTQFNAGMNNLFGNVNPSGVPYFIHDVRTIGAHPSNTSVVALASRPFGLYQLSGGTTWVRVSGFANGADHKPQSIAMTPAGRVFYSLFDQGLSTPGGLFRSTATGSDIGTLASAGVPIFDPNPGLGIVAGAWRVRPSPTSPHIRVFLMVYGDVPYRSMDGGTNWSRVVATASGFQHHIFFDIAEKVTAPATLVASTNKGIYRSTDDGANWGRVAASGLTQTALAAVVYAPNGNLFGGDPGGQLYCSTNDGTTWQAVTGGNLGATIRDMKYLNGSIHVLTDGAGFWKKDTVCP